ncbi:MAG: sigma-70 family RNA polymerase sigma factor [Limisphaerales bacterium]
MTADDMELVRQYAADQSESAFAALVSRHTNLVYSAALRAGRDPQLAEEITQAVFIILARKAGSLNPKTILPSWLYRAACYVSRSALKAEYRRQQREQKAYMQSTLDEPQADAVWKQLSPLLEEAMLQLSQTDRDALVLRFFEGRSLGEVGTAMGASEEAVKKRVGRALEKLRKFFSKRGVSSTTAIIAGAISVNSVQAAPAALAKTATAAALAKGAAASTSTLTLIKGALKIMAWTKAKTVVIGAGIFLVAGTGVVVVKSILPPREPRYAGKTLLEWLPDIDYSQPQDKRANAGEALRQMGAKTLPFLLADLGDAHYSKAHYAGPDKRTGDERSRQATWAFDALGAIGKPAIAELTKMLEQNPGYVPGALGGIGRDALPELLHALTNGSFWVRDNTAAYLAKAIFSGKITADAAGTAFPVAISNLTYTSTNDLFQGNTRSRAAWLVGALKLEPEVSVPALLRGLEDTNLTVAANCAFGLGCFGEDAREAVAALNSATNSTNALLSLYAKQALTAIVKQR